MAYGGDICCVSLIQPTLKRLRQTKVPSHARARGFWKDEWSCGYQLLHIGGEVIAHWGSLEEINVILTHMLEAFILEAMRIALFDSKALSWKISRRGASFVGKKPHPFCPLLLSLRAPGQYCTNPFLGVKS